MLSKVYQELKLSSATMSLNDSHGDIIKAIKASFENRVNIDLKIN